MKWRRIWWRESSWLLILWTISRAIVIKCFALLENRRALIVLFIATLIPRNAKNLTSLMKTNFLLNCTILINARQDDLMRRMEVPQLKSKFYDISFRQMGYSIVREKRRRTYPFVRNCRCPSVPGKEIKRSSINQARWKAFLRLFIVVGSVDAVDKRASPFRKDKTNK